MNANQSPVTVGNRQNVFMPIGSPAAQQPQVIMIFTKLIFLHIKKAFFINILNFDNLQQQYSTTPSPISYSLNSSQVIRPESLRPQIVTQSHHTQYQVKN